MGIPALPAFAAAAAIALSCTALDAAATSVLPLDLDQIVDGARHIAHVRCIGNEVRPDAAVGAVTVTTFTVLDRVKGDRARTFTVRQAGGTLNGVAFDYHVPQFNAGSEYVVFVPAASRLGLASPVGLEQGAFAVGIAATGKKEAGNGTDFAVLLSAADHAAATGNVAARLKVASPARGRMELSDFMTLLKAKAGAQ